MMSIIQNARDRSEQANARRDMDAQDRQLASDYKKVLSTNEGVRVLWDILSMCSIYTECFSEKDGRTEYNLGRRSLGIMLMDKIENVDPDLLINILKERSEWKKKYKMQITK